jgi:hypothetical protein
MSSIPLVSDPALQAVDLVLSFLDDAFEFVCLPLNILSAPLRLGKRDVQPVDLSIPFMKDRRSLSNDLVLMRNDIAFLLAKGVQLFKIVVPVADRLTNIGISVSFAVFESTLTLVQLLTEPLFALQLTLLQPLEAIILVDVLGHEVVTRFLALSEIFSQAPDCVISCILELAVAPSHCFKPILCSLCFIPPACQLELVLSKAIFQICPGNLRCLIGSSSTRFEVRDNGVLGFQSGFEFRSLLQDCVLHPAHLGLMGVDRIETRRGQVIL